MKRLIIIPVMILALALMIAPAALAGNGQGAGQGLGQGGGSGAGDGTGPIHDPLSGVPFTYQGTVVSTGFYGGGLVLAVGDENQTVYGLGPISYWTAQGVEPPSVGEELTVSGYTVDYNGVSRDLAFTITIGEQTIQLRDPDTGLTLWRGGNN